MTIRHALASDVPEIVAMATTFADTSEYRTVLRPDPPHVAALAERLIADEDGTVLVAQGAGGDLCGMLALHAFAHPMTGERVASELAWWVAPVHRQGRVGLALFQAGEQWARAQGAVWFQMIAPNDKVAAFYERQGFTKVETAYQRRM